MTVILYHSAYGHTEGMARAVVEGVGEAGAQVVAACASKRS